MLFTIGDIGATAISSLTSIFGYIITFVAGIMVAVLSWAIGVILQISLDTISSPAIQAGYSVTLSIANLGFLLGVIIVAIATILRNQTYGIKTFLYKIVVMAVLVNFGLILAGGLINISNSFTQYFLDGITGGRDPGINSAAKFSQTMTSAFQPQSLLIPYKEAQTSDPAVGKEYGAAGEFQKILQPIAGFFMIVISMVLIIITLTAFLVMLVIRYVWLVMLLVTLPLAWMAWVFPYLAKHFQTWWSKFIQQILFPPVALFFLWLSLTVGKAMFQTPPSIDSSTPLGAVGSLLAALAIPMLNIVVLSFLMTGGLMAAQSLGADFAGSGMKWATGAKDWALKRAGRKATRGLSRPFQGEGVQKRAQEMMKTGGYFQRLVGRGLTMAARPGGVNQVADYEKQYGGLSKQQLLEEFRADPLGHNKNSRAALLNLLQKQNSLADLTPTEIKDYVSGDENKKVFAQIGQGKARDEILDATGFNAKEQIAKMAELQSDLSKAADDATRKAIEEQIGTATAALQKSLGKMSAEVMAGFFKNEEGEAKNPLAMNDDEFKNFKNVVAKAMVGQNGITVSKYSSFISQLQEKGGSQGVAAFIESNKEIKSEDINSGIKKWLANTGARNFGIDGYYPGDESAPKERAEASGLVTPSAEDVNKFGKGTSQTPENIKTTVGGKEEPLIKVVNS